SGMSNRVAETTTASVSTSLGDGVGKAPWQKEISGAKASSAHGRACAPRKQNQTGRFRIQVTSNSESRTCMAEAAPPSSHSAFCEEVFSVCVVAGIVDPGRRGHRPRLQPNEVDRTNILAPGFRSS